MIKGQCKRCGKCCEYGQALVYTIYKNQKTGHEIMLFREVKKEILEGEHIPCTSLFYEDDGKASCKRYRNRPEQCNRYPSMREEIVFKECGYYVDDEKENMDKGGIK